MQARMDGKNCIVTGANSGIGFATAEELASRCSPIFQGASVYMVCRSKERGEVALSKIQCSTGNQKVYLEVFDLLLSTKSSHSPLSFRQRVSPFMFWLSGELRTKEEGADTIVWLALQPKEKLVSGGCYFDRVEAPKHLPFADTAGSHVIIDAITDILHSISGIPS